MADRQNDIEKYLRGELTPVEMNRLEREALDDPFLAEALEGLGSLSAADREADRKYLTKSLAKRVDNNRKIGTWWLRIAAAVALILTSSYVAYLIVRPSTNAVTPLALNKPLSTEQSKREETAPSPSVTTPTFKQNEQPQAATSRSHQMPKHAQQGEVDKEITTITEDEPVAINDVAAAEIEKPQVEVVMAEPIVQPAPELKKEAVAADKLKSVGWAKDDADMKLSYSTGAAITASNDTILARRKLPTRTISGFVTDGEDGTAMPGVDIRLKGTSIGVVTDADGHFNFTGQFTDESSLVFSFVGMQSVELPAKADTLNATLNPDYASLSEVVVVGYASKSDGVVQDGDDTYELATPVGGRKAYRNYLITSMHYPQVAIDNHVEGRVTVQFIVGSQGLLSDFTVTRGIGYGCDQELIRLVKEGPKWTPTKRNDVAIPNKVKVRLKFKLP